jgi:surface polysaccharide O-acyltransferase-like enzyme
MKRRETELDILRIGALLMVILVHLCGIQIETLPASDQNWQLLVFLRGLVTWEVPVYVMISGRFFLDPERNCTFRKIGNSILRLGLAFALWSLVYQIYYVITGVYADLNWKGILSEALSGPYHFWYLWMLIFMYAITPFLRKITEDKKLMEYFIILYLAFQFLTEYGPELPLVGTTINQILSKTYFHFTLGFSGYYILGFYLYKYRLSDKAEMLLYAVGTVLLLAAACANTSRSIDEGFEDVWYTQYLLPNIIIESMAVYTFAVKRLSKLRISDKAVRLITTLSDYSFGVFLIHALVIELCARIGLTPTLIHPLIMVPVFTALVYAVCHLAAVLLRKIPFIGKHMT